MVIYISRNDSSAGVVEAMVVKWIPQRRDIALEYQFQGEKIVATLDGRTDIFDFSGLPDGEASEISSILDPCPVLGAKRVRGRLHVTLLRPVGPRPTSSDFETEEEFEQALDAWKSLWTDLEEEVI